MYKVYVDSTDRYEKKVSLVDVDKEKEIASVQGDLDVAVEVKKLLGEKNISLGDVASFEANPGPGSFTGIKLGITFANIMNWALGKKTQKDLQSPEYGRPPNISKKVIK